MGNSPSCPENQPSLLIDLVNERRYHEAFQYLSQHPENVSSVDSLDRTALHILCDTHIPDENTLNLVETLVKLRPELVGTPDSLGWTPLHYCVLERSTWRGSKRQSQSPELALLLIRAYPKAVNSVRETSQGLMTPFHLACQANADTSVLQAMLKVNPRLACSKHHDSTNSPLRLLWKTNSCALDKLALILLTVYEGSVVDPPLMPMHKLLHAACCQPCPRMVFDHILKHFPEQASRKDDCGNLPLHYAVRHHAGNENMVMTLVAMYPQALHTLDATNGLFPVLIAAMDGSVSLTYSLLRTSPDIIVGRHFPTETSASSERASSLSVPP